MMTYPITLNDQALTVISDVQEVSRYLWERQWAERNGGNISVDLTDCLQHQVSQLSGFAWQPLEDFPAASAGRIYLVKGTGERIRDFNSRADQTGCILRIDNQAAGYHLLWGGKAKPDYQPTSEFITHVSLLLADSGRSAVVHTHPHELIALSHYSKLSNDSAAFENACWSMLPEVRIFVPKGIGLVPFELPGSQALADVTAETLSHKDVAVWEKHGALAAGADVMDAFDLIDVANKGAAIYLTCLKAGFEPEGLGSDRLALLASHYKL